MPYTPLPSFGAVSVGSSQGTMPTYGTNLRDFSQLLDTNNALHIENYWIHGSGRLVKRKGSTQTFDTTESDTSSLWKEYVNGLEIVGYGAKIRGYDSATGTFTNIKTDFTASNGGFSGVRTGDYFFVTNILDGMWRISRTFTYSQLQASGATQNKFTITNTSGAIGATITGVTSGATANVVSSTGTTTITAVVNTIVGTFVHGESITSGTLVGAALTNINPFTTALRITGATSGATAIVLEDSDAGATGTLTLGSISGTFVNGEVITDTATPAGRGTLTSAVSFTITAVTAAPKAKYVDFAGNRLIVYNLATDPAAWAYSNADTGTNPPFTDWTSASGFNSPGAGYYRNGKEALTFALIGDIYFLGFSKGWYAFTITQTEIGGVSSKYDQTVQTSDLGMRKVLMTDVGLIACGDFGVKRLVSLGQPNIPYSEQWETLTEQLGEDYFDDVNFDSSDIVYDDKRGYIYVACAKGGGTTGNYILAIKADLAGTETDVKTGAVSFFTGLNPYRFMKKDGDIYFTSSIDGLGINLFEGENDLGVAIYSQYYQELNFGTVTDSFNLDEFKLKAELSPATTITLTFDTFDENGYFEETRREYSITTTNSYTGGGGWGGAPWGSSGWGAGGTASGLVYDAKEAMPKLRNLTRVRVRFESADTADHILAIFSARVSITHATRGVRLAQV